jgi:hypothetical protein
MITGDAALPPLLLVILLVQCLIRLQIIQLVLGRMIAVYVGCGCMQWRLGASHHFALSTF